MLNVQQEPIAIIGMGCRFPGAESPHAYWKLLSGGRDAIREVPADRWDAQSLYDRDLEKPGKMVSRWGGFLDQVDQFDWRAFRMLPREAQYMDPQHRLLLEVAWEAFEDAGLPFEKIAGSRTGVFIGICWNDYLRLQSPDLSQINGYMPTGNALVFASNRLSYFFDLQGPSVSMDAGCTSSLTSLYLACQSLWSDEAEMALAGGVNLILSPDITLMTSKAGLLSPDGKCKTWDAQADGFVRGEGAGVLVLKRLSQVEPGDRIYAVIEGIATNHNGHNAWITAPSLPAQEKLLQEAYRKARIDPAAVDYVELHGTGFLKGDQMEATALGKSIGSRPERKHPCLVGSVKTNIGHLESASGAASLIKVALSLYHRQIPPTLHFETINPAIDLQALHLAPALSLCEWPEKEGNERPVAGVTSLSMSGANAHVVLSVASVKSATGDHPVCEQPRLLPLSATSAQSLLAQARAWCHFLLDEERVGQGSWRDICYSASVRRSHHRYRLFVIGQTPQEAATALQSFLQQDNAEQQLLSQDRERGSFSLCDAEISARAFLERAGKAYVSGQDVDWSALYPDGGRCMSLPAYAWQRERLWFDQQETVSTSTAGTRSDPTPALSSDAQEPRPALLTTLLEVPEEKRKALLQEHLTRQVAHLLEYASEQVLSPDISLFDAGMRSTTATRLMNHLQENLGCTLSLVAVFNYPTIERLCGYLLTRIEQEHLGHHQEVVQGIEQSQTPLTDVDNLSEQEVLSSLLAKLADIERI